MSIPETQTTQPTQVEDVSPEEVVQAPDPVKVLTSLKRRRVTPEPVKSKTLAEQFEVFDQEEPDTEELDSESVGSADSETSDEEGEIKQEEEELDEELGYMEKFFNREFMQHTKPAKTDDEYSTPMLLERIKSILKGMMKREISEHKRKRLSFVAQNVIMCESRVMQMRQALMQMRLAVEMHQFRGAVQQEE